MIALHLLVVVSSQLLLRGCTPLPTSAEELPSSTTEDYNNFDDDTTAPSVPRATDGGPPQLCDYNPCREGQTSCEELLRSTGCLCPGSTQEDEAPDAPSLKAVSRNGSGVVVRWCAPSSHVNVYVVTVGGLQEQEFGWDKRSGVVQEVNREAEVCVAARNDAGDSKKSCLMYRPTDSSLPLTAGLIAGGLGLLLLTLLAVLLWRSRRQKKQEAHVSMSSTGGRH